MNTKKEYFVTGITLVSVIVILYQYLEKNTKVHVNLIKQIELTEISEPQDSTVKKHEKTTGQVADKVVKEKLKVP